MNTLITLVTVDEDYLYSAYQSAHYVHTGETPIKNAGDFLREVAAAFVEDHHDEDYFNWYGFRTDIPAAYLAERGLTKLSEHTHGQHVTFDRILTVLVENGENIAY